MPDNSITDKPIIFFDGYCGLCNNAVDRLMQMDKKGLFLFSPLQGNTAKQLGINPGDTDPDSIILHYKGALYYKSTAALKALRILGGFSSIAGLFLVVPRFLRDGIYNIIARNRYKWFGRKETCRIPTPEERSRFLD